MKNKTVRRIAQGLACILALSAVSCSNQEKLLESSKDEKTVVMTIDGFDVPMELYRYVALNYKAQYEKGNSSEIWLGENGQTLLAELDENVDKSLIKLYTTLSLARDYGIDIESAFVKDTLESSMDIIYDTYEGDYAAYVSYLEEYNMTDNVYRFFVRNDILSEELVNAMLVRGEIPTEDEELRAVIDSDEFIRIKQVLIPFDNGISDEENRQKAEELYNRAAAGEDFDMLVQNYGGDLFMFNNPDGYYMCKGTYHTAFEEAAFSLDVGEISDVVETDAGYSIIKRYEKESAYLTKHFNDLADSYVESCYNLALEEREKQLNVTDTDKLADYPLFNLSMNDED